MVFISFIEVRQTKGLNGLEICGWFLWSKQSIQHPWDVRTLKPKKEKQKKNPDGAG